MQRLVLLLLGVSCLSLTSAGGGSGGDTIGMHAVTRDSPYCYKIENGIKAKALIELSLTVQPKPKTECSTRSANLSTAKASEKTRLYISLEEWDTFSQQWLPLGNTWKVELEEDEELQEINEWDIVDELGFAIDSTLRLNFTTNSDLPIAFTFHAVILNLVGRYQVAIAAVLLAAVYLLIIFEVVHRTIAAMLGVVATLIALYIIRERPPLSEVVTWMDEGTIGLLLGMMIIVGVFSTTGFFEWGALRAFKLAKGKSVRLMILLSLLTGALSAFLDNVTTILLVAPVTLRLAAVLGISPTPFILAEVFFSNIGGTSAMIGDPPNIMVGSMIPELSFFDFIINLAPALLIATPPTLLVLALMSLRELRGADSTRPNIEDLEREYVIHDKRLCIKVAVVLALVIAMFFLERVTHIEPAWCALAGAALLLVITTPDEIDPFLQKVEWSTLLFFAALFVLIHGLQEMGLIRAIGDLIADVIRSVEDEESRLTVALQLVLWASALVSSLIDNIPYTATMIPVVLQLTSEDEGLNLPLRPVVWALAFGACLGGNATLIGASANVVAAGISDQAGHPISFVRFLKYGVPVFFVSLSVCSLYVQVVYVWLGFSG